MVVHKSPRKTPPSWRYADQVPPPGGRPILVRVFPDVGKHPARGEWWLGRCALAVVTANPDKGVFWFVGEEFPIGSIEKWANLPPE